MREVGRSKDIREQRGPLGGKGRLKHNLRTREPALARCLTWVKCPLVKKIPWSLIHKYISVFKQTEPELIES
jgi:hypothetical protein